MCKQVECTKLKEFNKIQIEIILQNIEKHKWYRHINNDTEAKISFIKEFGGIMRQVFCYTCEFHKRCEAEEEVSNG